MPDPQYNEASSEYVAVANEANQYSKNFSSQNTKESSQLSQA